MTDAIEQLASKLSVDKQLIINIINDISQKVNQKITAHDIILFINIFNIKFTNKDDFIKIIICIYIKNSLKLNISTKKLVYIYDDIINDIDIISLKRVSDNLNKVIDICSVKNINSLKLIFKIYTSKRVNYNKSYSFLLNFLENSKNHIIFIEILEFILKKEYESVFLIKLRKMSDKTIYILSSILKIEKIKNHKLLNIPSIINLAIYIEQLNLPILPYGEIKAYLSLVHRGLDPLFIQKQISEGDYIKFKNFSEAISSLQGIHLSKDNLTYYVILSFTSTIKYHINALLPYINFKELYNQYLNNKNINYHLNNQYKIILNNTNINSIDILLDITEDSKIIYKSLILIYLYKNHMGDYLNSLHKNKSIQNKEAEISKTINLFSSLGIINEISSNISQEYIDISSKLKIISSPIRNPYILIDDIIFHTSLKIDLKDLLDITEIYNSEFNFQDFCYIYAYILKIIPQEKIKDINQYIPIYPTTFESFKSSFSKFDGNLYLLENQNNINKNPEIIETKNTTSILASYFNKIYVKNDHFLLDRSSGLWKDITSNKREYAIPSQGILVIETEDDIAEYTYLKSLRFIQEGFNAPSIRIELSFHIPTIKYNTVEDVIIQKDGSITGFIDKINNQGYITILRYLLIAIYHALVVPETSKPTHGSRSSYRGQSSNNYYSDSRRSLPRTKGESNRVSIHNWHQSLSKSQHIVVAHKRFIEDGYDAPHDKYLQAKAAGVILELGYTWVQEHTRGGIDSHPNNNQAPVTRFETPVSVTSNIRKCLPSASSSLQQPKPKRRR